MLGQAPKGRRHGRPNPLRIPHCCDIREAGKDSRRCKTAADQNPLSPAAIPRSDPGGSTGPSHPCRRPGRHGKSITRGPALFCSAKKQKCAWIRQAWRAFFRAVGSMTPTTVSGRVRLVSDAEQHQGAG
jgi:hypothetical protein